MVVESSDGFGWRCIFSSVPGERFALCKICGERLCAWRFTSRERESTLRSLRVAPHRVN
jgi:hypothetical protein